MENILVGLSTQNRTGKYLYYGAFDTDDIGSLVAGELGMFWANKSAGADSVDKAFVADGGNYVAGGNNDDATSLAGTNVDIADTLSAVTEIDKFYFVQGIGDSKAKVGLILNTKELSFKVLEYVAPVKKVQTVTIPAASIVAGKIVRFDLYSKTNNPGYAGGLKNKNVEYIMTGVGATDAAALAALINGTGFATKWLNTTTAAFSTDVVVTVTWNTSTDGTIVADTTSTATVTVATGTAFKEGHGTGAQLVSVEKEIKVREGYNPSNEASDLYSAGFDISAAKNYHQIIITSRHNGQDPLGSRDAGVLVTQTICIDTADTNNVLLEEIVSILTDLVEKRAIASGL